MENGRRVADARLEVFGLAPRPARIELLDRSTSWRATRALLAAAIGIGAAPVVFFLPLHFPWATASIAIGLYIARNRWKERRTLLRLAGECPACGAPVDLRRPERLRESHTLHCPACGREIAVDVA